MVVRLRLARHGTRNNPFYHLVAIADHKPRDALPIEKLGEYDPIPRPAAFRPPKLDPNAPVLSSGLPGRAALASGADMAAEGSKMGGSQAVKLEKRLELDGNRIKYWLSVGAQPSKPVAKMLDKAGLIPEGKFYKGMFRHPLLEPHSNPLSPSAFKVNQELEA
ncbi:ribosomal protein S16 [Microstroma glucosiphilum]|uniref:Ribosomal protein S16 n=1 Tax=Pseudomicrostroma glucosiphilum TaxID=1684307 RepID=A0A316UBM0_9BASI|nr:ribosomal protein S16 [Pseudomicrostroma glucosiphilum]PWN21803.1 ribosomal protein S16 [Pseudomicrostroma glucosiphilum]